MTHPSEHTDTPPLNRIGLPETVQRASDWLMHAKGCRRRAHDYKQWALEAEAAGNLSTYRHFRAESDKSWRGAWKALREARLMQEISNV